MDPDRSHYTLRTSVQVRNYEVDWQGIVHNAVYLLYCETGRIEYLQAAGVQIDLESIRKESLIVVARNEIDYLSPARFGETLNIFTRISAIGNSSFTFESLIESESDGRGIARNRAVHVWLDQSTGKPTPVPGWFRDNVAGLEKGKTGRAPSG